MDAATQKTVLIYVCVNIYIFCMAFSIMTNLNIQRVNMFGYWSLLACATILAIFAFKTERVWTTLLVTASLFIISFLLIEVMYFVGKVGVWNEQERVQSSYQWFDVYLDSTGKDKTADLTEGYFADDQWNVSPEQALRQKYDKFFDILRLKEGMVVLDIGCGYGQWMSYLKERGVASVGLTLADVHVEEGKRKGLDIRLQDGRKLPKDYYGKFDAVTLLGSLEHFAKCYYTDDQRRFIYRSIMQKAKLALKSTSDSRAVMTTTINVDAKKFSISDYLKCYILERFYSGRYPVLGELNEAAGLNGMQRVYDSDQTEDYRWMSIINPDHFGNFKINTWTLKRLFYIPYMLMTDPFAIHKWLYHGMNVWMWHLGGLSRVPDRTRSSPCILKWEAFRIV